MFKYSVYTSWSDEDECYVALIPELPGLSAFGETPEEAVAEAKLAAKGFIKAFKEDGCEIPLPHKLSARSGQTRLRLPKSLHAALAQEAKVEGVSFNSYIINLLAERHITHKIYNSIQSIQGFLIGSLWKAKAEAGDTGSQVIIKDIKTVGFELEAS